MLYVLHLKLPEIFVEKWFTKVEGFIWACDMR